MPCSGVICLLVAGEEEGLAVAFSRSRSSTWASEATCLSCPGSTRLSEWSAIKLSCRRVDSNCLAVRVIGSHSGRAYPNLWILSYEGRAAICRAFGKDHRPKAIYYNGVKRGVHWVSFGVRAWPEVRRSRVR